MVILYLICRKSKREKMKNANSNNKKPCNLFHNKIQGNVNLKSNTMKNTQQI